MERLVWAGNSGTPSRVDHCGSTPGGSTTTNYAQPFSYDVLDRITSGSAGTESYGDSSHVHAVTSLSTIPNQYASYDAMGNMTCRTTDTTGSQTCGSGTQTGATMTYDNEGRLVGWTAPTGLSDSDQYLYDNEGNRVLQRTSVAAVGSTTPTITDTITFNQFTDVTIMGGTSTVTNYYMVAGQRVAMRKGATLSYLMPDFLGSDTIALNFDGSVQSVQLFAPYGGARYNDQIMPTDHNFTGQRLDEVTGLLYYNARYYDSVGGRFISPDGVVNNSSGMDPYAYVRNNPETKSDPTGHDVCDATCITTVVGTAGAAGIELGPGDIAVMGIALVGILAWNAYSSSHQQSVSVPPSNTVAANSMGIDIGLANKPRPWSPDEAGAVAGKVSAWGEEQRNAKIADAEAAGVALPENEDPAKSNVAAAFLAITDASGATTTYENFALGYKGADDQDHAEALLITWAGDIITEQSASRALVNVNLLIWSGKTPCKLYCRPLLYDHIWLEGLWNDMGIPQGTGWANLDFYAGGIPGTPFKERYSFSYNGYNIIQRNRMKDL